ncbi:MAG: DUF4339 domain-containing protein [Bacteroides sp.]|nr:DUF4339 domain-containing protein [Bacteroides sp.]
MERIYYIVVNNTQQGPFSKEELRIKNLSPETLIWRTGMPQWVKIADFPEVADIMPRVVVEEINETVAEEDGGWYAMLGDRRIGPSTPGELIAAGVSHNTPVWHAGMPDWANASTQIEFAERFNSNGPYGFGQQPKQGQYPNFNQNPQYGRQPNFSQNPQYGQQPNFAQNPQYGQQPNFRQNPQYGQQPNYDQQNNYGSNQYGRNQFSNQPVRTDWMPWAIGATVVAFLFSCIGVIFGIIGIIQANKANGLYAAGFEGEAAQANNTARTMTIIAYALAALGLITSVFFLKSYNFYNFI